MLAAYVFGFALLSFLLGYTLMVGSLLLLKKDFILLDKKPVSVITFILVGLSLFLATVACTVVGASLFLAVDYWV